MAERDDGGPAFPWGEHGTHLGGMSLRDYFAAKAMHAELNTSGWHAGSAAALVEAAESTGRTVEQQIAVNSYTLADAMLAERAK